MDSARTARSCGLQTVTTITIRSWWVIISSILRLSDSSVLRTPTQNLKELLLQPKIHQNEDKNIKVTFYSWVINCALLMLWCNNNISPSFIGGNLHYWYPHTPNLCGFNVVFNISKQTTSLFTTHCQQILNTEQSHDLEHGLGVTLSGQCWMLINWDLGLTSSSAHQRKHTVDKTIQTCLVFNWNAHLVWYSMATLVTLLWL